MKLRLLLALASVVVGVAALEVGLWIAGFSFRLWPEQAVFGWPDPITVVARYAPDPDVFWVPRNYRTTLERARGERPAVAFLGDSCTEFGSYHQLLMEQVARDTGRRVPWVALGVGGWSSWQGLQQLRRDVLPLRPRVVTLYYGWNDHWIGYGIEDREVSRLNRSLLYRLQGFRLAQLVTKAFVARSATAAAGGHPERVSPADFRENLAAMVREARAAGVAPVLLTAPSSHEPGREPEQLEGRWLRKKADLIPLHQRYVAIVREVAAAEGAALCDLARRFEEVPREERGELFNGDGIHLTMPGDAVIALELHRCLEREGLLRRITD
jgi:lysophospholipase L1-like esterase